MGKLLTRLLRLSLCTTGNASVNYSMYVPQRPSKVPIAPMGFSHVLRVCLQGGGVRIDGGTMTFCLVHGGVYLSASLTFPVWRADAHRLAADAGRR